MHPASRRYFALDLSSIYIRVFSNGSIQSFPEKHTQIGFALVLSDGYEKETEFFTGTAVGQRDNPLPLKKLKYWRWKLLIFDFSISVESCFSSCRRRYQTFCKLTTKICGKTWWLRRALACEKSCTVAETRLRMRSLTKSAWSRASSDPSTQCRRTTRRTPRKPYLHKQGKCATWANLHITT